MAEAAPGKTGQGTGENEGVNVQVLLRCRPMSEKEIAERAPQVISCSEATREVILHQNVNGKLMSRTFRFDKVFSSEASQEKLYRQAIVPIVQEVMDGFNCTIFAYGQTGTGKTYTMEGGPRRSDDGKSLSAEAGVIPRSIKQIFDSIDASNADSTVKVSFLELYNEELTDLLSFDDAKDDKKALRLLEDRNGVVVQGLEEVSVKSAAEIYQVLDRGTAKRRTAETLLNKRSSRSHSVFSITIHMREVTPEGEDVVKVGKLHLVDLAGSENISRSGAKDGRAREAGSINQSLLTLGRVITALVEHSGHVPYRDSKLTRLLRDSLGGKTKTCIIATIAPTVQCQEETISTLDYAHRAKNIRNRPEINQKISKTAMIKEMSTEMEKLRLELVAQREKNGVFISVEKFQQDEIERVQLRETVKTLREEMKLEQEEFAQQIEQQRTEAERTISRLESELATARSDLEFLDMRLQEASRTIHERQYLIAAHRKAEQDIAEHAEAVRSELAEAVRDIGELFASLEELSSVHAADRDSFQMVRGMLEARLKDIGTSLSGAVDNQRKQLNAMNVELASFKQRKQDDLQQLMARVSAVQSMIMSIKETVDGRALAAGAAAGAALGRVGELASAHVASAVSAAQVLEATTRAAVDALSESIELQTRELISFADEQASFADSSCKALRSTMKRFTESYGALQATATQGESMIEQETTSLNAGLGSFATRFKDVSIRQQTELVAQIAALVHAFTEERASDVARGVKCLQQQAAEAADVIRGKFSDISQATTTAIRDLQDAEESHTSNINSHQQQSRDRTTSMTSSLGTLNEKTRALHEEVTTRAHGSAAAAEALNQDLGQVCDQGVTTVQAAVQTCINETSDQVSSARHMLLTFNETLEEVTANSRASADEWATLCTDVIADMTAMNDRQAADLSTLSIDAEAVVQQRLDVVLKTVPPEQRDIKVPPSSSIRELRCLSEDKLVARCHIEFPQVFAAPLVQPGRESPRAGLVRVASGPAALVGCENATPMPLNAAIAPVNGSGPTSPRSSMAGMRSRIPSKPSLVSSSPASVKDQVASAVARQQLSDRTNAGRQGQSILAEW
ncbi:hypothetical protein Vretifemale_14633 [Volvox reticuliferus]|uniref:Kinesin motor domain-containing protein n=1 Tax=Volvox reticuliferus TaxID=1737510 RepID=A0A8J4CRS0_9CHLO|nr:hypothetical protein Vretifemale_14633 [Volvox reticuliferus]